MAVPFDSDELGDPNNDKNMLQTLVEIFPYPGKNTRLSSFFFQFKFYKFRFGF